LNLAISKDSINWEAALVLEKDPGEYSYPAIIQTADGMVHITYTWKRLRVRHLMIDPAMLSCKAIVDVEWPK
jgi:alpha-L-rhamnosidase